MEVNEWKTPPKIVNFLALNYFRVKKNFASIDWRKTLARNNATEFC